MVRAMHTKLIQVSVYVLMNENYFKTMRVNEVKRQTRPLDMAPFGKKLADKGIYNQRHKIGGQSEHYYDGMKLIWSMRSREQSSLCQNLLCNPCNNIASDFTRQNEDEPIDFWIYFPFSYTCNIAKLSYR
jgi:hypothetical protein